MEHEQRNGRAPLAGMTLENGRAGGSGSATNGHDVGANGHDSLTNPGVANRPAGSNGVVGTNGQASLERKLEYVDRSVGGSNAAVGSGRLDEVDRDEAGVGRAEAPRRLTGKNGRVLQQVGEARRRQSLSIRCVAQRLGMTVGEVRAQEEPDADMLLSELYRWQSVLDVPLEELLADPQDALSPRVLMRARMLRVMKTARALRAQARSEAEHRLAKLLIGQLIEIMPELKEVAAWPTVGHRRTADEIGRIGERPIPDDFMHEAS